MASEVADIPRAVKEKIEAEDRKLVDKTTNIVLDNLSKEETMDAEVIPNEHYEISNSTFEVENVKNSKEASAVAGEGENFLNLSSMAKVSDEENNSSPDAYEVIEKTDQSNKDACKIQSLKDEKLDNQQEEIIATKETSLEEIPQYAEELSSSLDKVADRGDVPVEDLADATSGLKVKDSIHAPDSEDVRIDTSIGETSAEKFGSGRNGKMEENFDVTLEKGSQETITFSEDTLDATENECEFQNPNKSESSFLKDTEDSVIKEGYKTTTAAEVSKVEDNSIQTSEKVEVNSLKQVDESQIKHEECIKNESGKLSSTEAPTQDIDHEEIEAGDLGKAKISEETISPSLEQRLCANLSDETTDKTIDAADMKDFATIDPNEEPGGSIPCCSTNDLKVTHQLKEEKENDGPSIDAHHNPVKNSNICSKEGGDQINSLDDLDDSKASHEVTGDQSKEIENQTTELEVTHSSENIEWKKDLNITHPLEEGKDNDGPSIDAPINNSNNICSKGGGDQINSLQDPNDSEASCEVTEDQIKETKTQVNDDQKMTSKPDDTETQTMERENDTTTLLEATADETIKIDHEMNEDQKMTSKPHEIETKMMDREHDATIQSEATTDEPIRICQEVEIETTELEVIHSSENKWKKDLNITHLLEEGKDNDGPPIDAPVNNNSNMCNKEGGDDQINSLEEGSREVTEGQSKETETQTSDDQNITLEREDDTNTQSKATADETIEIGKKMNEDQKMTSKPNDIETQMMDREHDTTIQSETIADEPIEICEETTELENTLSSESIEKIIQLDENKNQHVYVASILEEKVAESFEGKKNITDIPSQEVEDSYPMDDGMDNSTQTINADSGAKDNFTALTAEKRETEVSFEQENEMNEPDTEDVATTDLNEATGGSIPHYSANDLNPLEEGKDNDGPSIDIHVNDSNNKCSEGIGDWINGLEDQDDSEASREVTEYQGKETGSQVTDDDKMTSEPDNIETQRMDREQNTTIRSEATNDETIKICQEVNDDQKMTSKPDDIETQIMDMEHDTTIQSEATADEAKNFHETTRIEVTHCSENIEKIIILDENRNQHVSVASILEEKNAESFEGDETITDIPSQQEGVSYQGHDGCIGNSAQIIKDSGANENSTVLSAEEMETGFLCEDEKKIKEPDTEILERRLRSQDTDLQIMMETDGFTDNFTAKLEENSAKESSQDDEGTHFSEDNKVKTLKHEEESNTTSTIQSSIHSKEEEMSSKDCLEFAQNMSSVSGISEGSREDIIGKTELAVTVGTEDPNLKEVEILDKVQLDENDLASEKLGVATSKPDKKEAESIDIEAECESISNLGENRDVNVSMMGGNEVNETITGETTKYEVENETQAALSNCNDQVAASGNVSQNTSNLNLEESYNPSYEEQNLLPVSCNETKNNNSENIEGSSIIPDSSSALKTSENIDIEKAIVGQEGNARNADDFLKENLDTQKAALESKTEQENRMEDLDINSLNSMAGKAMQNLEPVEPSKEPPSTSEPVIELEGNKSNPESTITAVVDDGIKATEERIEPIGEVLISQHSLDGTVDTNDDEREHGADGKQHFDSIQEVEKVYQNDKTTEQEEKVIEQDFESSQREASCEKKIQLRADDTINRTPDCDQIIRGGSLSEEILQVQQKNENADSEGKIKERIEEECCPEDVQMIVVADAAPHEEKGLDSSSIKNLISDDSKEKITQGIAEGLNRKQEKSSVTEVPEDEKLVNITSLASIAREENCNEFTENNSYMTSDKVSPSNMLQGSASEVAQGTKDKNTPTQCHELPLSSDIKYSDMERTQMDVESWVERVDDIDVTNVMQNLDAASVPASDKLTVIDAYHTKNVEFFNSTVDNKYMPRLQQETAENFQAEGKIPKPSELEQEEAQCVQEERTADETIESTKQSVSTEIAKASLPDILQCSLEESSKMADHHTKGREPTVQKEELKAEKTEEAEHEEEKSDEEKDNHQESSEQKGSDLGFETPVLVDAGDVVTKVSYKKSHNILSGVGSKVKHSIAKVKKAIIGKSSHPKPPSPKESEKC